MMAPERADARAQQKVSWKDALVESEVACKSRLWAIFAVEMNASILFKIMITGGLCEGLRRISQDFTPWVCVSCPLSEHFHSTLSLNKNVIRPGVCLYVTGVIGALISTNRITFTTHNQYKRVYTHDPELEILTIYFQSLLLAACIDSYFRF